jgi:hypothetical protein
LTAESYAAAGTETTTKFVECTNNGAIEVNGTIVSGSMVIATLTQNDPVAQSSDYTMQSNGYGEYTVAA